jgi:hypothetical protein
MNRFFVALCMVMCITGLLAIDKDAGMSGFGFLKIPSSPAIAGMGNTGEMLQNSPLNFLHHPAAFEWKRGKSIAFSQNSWLVDTYLYNIAYRNIMFDRSFGLALKYMDHGSLEKRTDNGTLIGHYYPMDLLATVNYAKKLNPDIHVGANLSLIYEKIDTSSALGFATDVGLVYLTPLRYTNVDIALKNMGVSTKMDTQTIKLPFTAEMGVTYGYDISDDISVFPALKLVYMNDHDDILPALGVQIKLIDMLALRAGYKFNYNQEDFSAGFGVKYKNLTIDYSFMNFNSDLENVHLFGVGVSF